MAVCGPLALLFAPFQVQQAYSGFGALTVTQLGDGTHRSRVIMQFLGALFMHEAFQVQKHFYRLRQTRLKENRS